MPCWDALFKQREAQGEHVVLVGFYQYRARMARLVGDRTALVHALQSMRTTALTSGFPAVILLADRVAELRTKDMHPSAPAKLAEAAASAGQASDTTAVSMFLRNLDPATDRSARALQLLAGWMAADQAFLFARLAGSVQLVAALSNATVPARLREHVVAKLMGSAATSISAAGAVEVLELPDDAQRMQRFHIALLPDDIDPSLVVGAVVARECDALLGRMPADMLTDMGRVLAEDIRTERLTAKPPA